MSFVDTQRATILACVRCGFAPQEGGLLQVTDRGVECLDRSACNQRKADK